MKKVFTHMLIQKGSAGFLPRPGGMCLLLTSPLVSALKRAVSTITLHKSSQPSPGVGVLVRSVTDGIKVILAEKSYTLSIN